MWRFKQNFTTKLENELRKLATLQVECNMILKNIRRYLEFQVDDKGTQALIGHKALFRGVIVTDWFGSNDCETKYSDLNKVIVGHCVRFYLTCWKERNVRRNSETIKKKRMVEWAKNEKQSLDNAKFPQVRKYIENGYNSIIRASADTIQRWLIQLHSVRKRASQESTVDIRSFFSAVK